MDFSVEMQRGMICSVSPIMVMNCLGINYPIGVFPFKLALIHAFPVAIIWFSKIKGNGYKLNVKEICFSTIEEGVAIAARL